MKYEILAVVGLLFCLIVIAFEYFIHYRFAEQQDEKEANTRMINHRMKIRIEGVLYAPTKVSRDSEIKKMAEEINNDYEIYEAVIRIIESVKERVDEDEKQSLSKLIERVNDEVNPVSIYASMLEMRDVYHKGYAMRKLADLGAKQYRDIMIEHSKSKNRDLAYNAAMALAKLGDEENVAVFLKSIQNDRLYSSRIINEFFDEFEGDRASLAKLLFADCNTYMRSVIIKAITPYKIEEFHKMYIENCASKDFQLKVACVKAIATFGNKDDEQILQIAAQDNEWVVRISAVRGLALINTPTALASVKKALRDKEWWVRQAAANAITQMDISPRDLEDILGGYDRYAADAIKGVLYKKLDSLQ